MPKSKDSRRMQVVAHLVLGAFSLLVLVPFLVLVVSSFANQDQIINDGYSLIPKSFDLSAYAYLWNQCAQIFKAYGVTIVLTVVGTTINILLTTLIAYPLSRKDLPGRRVFMFLIFFTMLFNGGMVPTYLMYTTYFGLKNSYLALLVPNLLMSAWYVLLTRGYMVNNIPGAIVESAMVDGATDFTIYRRIVMPMARPIIATVGLFTGIAYWNDWFNGLVYLTRHEMFSLQNLLYRMMSDIMYLNSNSEMASRMAENTIPGVTVRMAIAIIGILPILIIYPKLQANFVKGIAIGAVKG